MDKTMTPSAITAGQIGKLQELFGAALRKSALPGEHIQQIIETQGDALTADLIAVVRKRVDAMSDMIVRRVKVNRNRTQQQVLDATGRKQYTDPKAVATMPKGEGDEVDVYFFPLRRFVRDDELAKEYELRGLKPDPYAQAAVNEVDPAFADERPNGTHWKGKGGQWYYAAFYRWDGGRYVYVSRSDHAWDDRWFFAGVRK